MADVGRVTATPGHESPILVRVLFSHSRLSLCLCHGHRHISSPAVARFEAITGHRSHYAPGPPLVVSSRVPRTLVCRVGPHVCLSGFINHPCPKMGAAASGSREVVAYCSTDPASSPSLQGATGTATAMYSPFLSFFFFGAVTVHVPPFPLRLCSACSLRLIIIKSSTLLLLQTVSGAANLQCLQAHHEESSTLLLLRFRSKRFRELLIIAFFHRFG